MKSTKSIQPSRLWHVTSIQDLERIKERGVYNFGRSIKLIHKLQFGFSSIEESEDYSSADCLGIREVESKNNPQYALIEINPEGLYMRLRRCHTEGIIVSKCVYTSDIFHIAPEHILGHEIRTIDLGRLLYFNDYRLRSAMHDELIQTKQPGCGLNPKELAHNNRISSEKHSAIWFNEMLIDLAYGDYVSNYYNPTREESNVHDEVC